MSESLEEPARRTLLARGRAVALGLVVTKGASFKSFKTGSDIILLAVMPDIRVPLFF